MRFARLSPDGLHVTGEGAPRTPGGLPTIWIDDRVVGEGIQPCWVSPATVLYARGARVIAAPVPMTTLYGSPLADDIHRLDANGRGEWLAWHARAGATGYTHSAQPTQYVAADVRPALGPSGGLWLPPAACIEPRWTAGGQSAIRHPSPPRIEPGTWAPWQPVTHWAVPVWTPDGPWILRLEDDRLVLHPSGHALGMVVAVGDTYWPDAIWCPSRGAVRVVASDARGRLLSWDVRLKAPRVVLEREPAPTPTPDLTNLTPGQPTMNTDFASFSWARCTVLRGDPTIGQWPITTQIEDLDLPPPLSPGIGFPWQNPGWPTATEPGVGADLVGNVWIIVQVNDRWYAATWDWLRFPDQAHKAEAPAQLGKDQIRQAPLDARWAPRSGEVVGLMVSTMARGETRTLNQRSGIAWGRINQEGLIGRESSGAPSPPPTPTPMPTQPTAPTPSDGSAAIQAAIAPLLARLAALEAAAVRVGDRVALQSASGAYVCAEDGGGGSLTANRTAVGAWEQFRVVR